jgi:hypothetical protein
MAIGKSGMREPHANCVEIYAVGQVGIAILPEKQAKSHLASGMLKVC